VPRPSSGHVDGGPRRLLACEAKIPGQPPQQQTQGAAECRRGAASGCAATSKGVGLRFTVVRVGSLELRPLDAGGFSYDGGVMFGPVPRVVWQKLVQPDAENKIRLSIRPLLVKAPGATVLIDTGLGDRYGDREVAMYGPDPGRGVKAALASEGVAPEDVDVVVLTHLHTDHAGGAVTARDGGLRPAFPKARYIVNEREWKVACDRLHPRATAYRRDDFVPLRDAAALDIVGDECAVGHGVTLIRTGGHTEGHLAVVIADGGETVLYPADLVPTRHHVRVPYIAGVDLYPVELMERKRELLDAASRGGWRVVLCHEPDTPLGQVTQTTPGRHQFTAAT
jgi:glyoxylase-like metal-dependent hydrolase (beta-lactamase superfamily II)